MQIIQALKTNMVNNFLRSTWPCTTMIGPNKMNGYTWCGCSLLIHMNKVATRVSPVLSNIMKSKESISTINKYILKAILELTDCNMHQVPLQDFLVSMKSNIYHGKSTNLRLERLMWPKTLLLETLRHAACSVTFKQYILRFH